MQPKSRTTEPEFSQTKPSESPESKEKGGRTRRAPDTGVWAIRGIDIETRSLIEKAARQAGKTIGQYVNEDIRAILEGHFGQTQLPDAPVDIQQQIGHLTQLVEALTNRLPEPAQQSLKKTLWQRLFGKQ